MQIFQLKQHCCFITKCKHNICLHCLLKLVKLECPMCRHKLDNLPLKIIEIIENKHNPKPEGIDLFLGMLENNYFLF